MFKSRGVRLYPHMRHYVRQLFMGLFPFFLLPAIFFVCLNYRAFMACDVNLIIVVVTWLVVGLIFSYLFANWLTVKVEFFRKGYRRAVITRFLWEKGYFYTKKGLSGKERVYFPKIYMKQGKDHMVLSFELAGSKYQSTFQKLGPELETMFGSDVKSITYEGYYIVYEVAYDPYTQKIKVSDVTFDLKEGLRLTKDLYWNPIKDPHLLISGGTGGGKTVLLRSIIRALAEKSYVVIFDPKIADFKKWVQIPCFKDRVFFTTEEITEQFIMYGELVNERYREINEKSDELGEHELQPFYTYGLDPVFVVCDEFNAYVGQLNMSQRSELEKALKEIVLKGRQAGIFFIPAMQKPSAEDLPSKIRDSIMFRIAVGRLSESGFSFMFDNEASKKNFKHVEKINGVTVYGHGYAGVYKEIPQEIYAPQLTKIYSFWNVLRTYDRVSEPFDLDFLLMVKEKIDMIRLKDMKRQSMSYSPYDEPEEMDLGPSTIDRLIEVLGGVVENEEEELTSYIDDEEIDDFNQPFDLSFELTQEQTTSQIVSEDEEDKPNKITQREVVKHLSEKGIDVTLSLVQRIFTSMKDLSYPFEEKDGKPYITEKDLEVFEWVTNKNRNEGVYIEEGVRLYMAQLGAV